MVKDKSKPRIVITGGSGFIGTNLVEFYNNHNWNVLNIDIAPPRNTEHYKFWTNINILHKDKLINAVKEFSPSILLHFAARTDLSESAGLEGYAANIKGVNNIIDAINSTPSVKRIIVASSQLVCKLGYQPTSFEDYCPNTLYGESKVHTERIVRSIDNDKVVWVIVRPTSIWGPWFDVPYKSFFDMINRGFYFHPKTKPIYKQWGFVYNSVYQINSIINAPSEYINKKTYYLADYEAINLFDFVKAVQKAFGAKRVKSVPLWLMKSTATIGDFLKLFELNFPLSSFRLNNIITNEIQDLTPLNKITGDLPYSYQQGIVETVNWMSRTNKEYESGI